MNLDKDNLPLIGYGTYPQERSLTQTAAMAYRYGYRLFDTSDNYDNEGYLGEALTLAEYDLENTIVVSKFSLPYRAEELDKCFLESKKRLKGKLDIYLLHWPYPFLWRYMYRKMEKLVLSGECAAIGVCNFDVKHMKSLLRMCKVRPIINQFERHPAFQQKEIYQYCMDEGIRVMCYSPLARCDESIFSSEAIQKIAKSHGKKVGQIILRWDIQHNTIPIPSTSKEKHIMDNFDIFDFSLNHEEMEQIDKLECGKRIRYNPRTRFSLHEKLSFLKHRCRIFYRDIRR